MFKDKKQRLYFAIIIVAILIYSLFVNNQSDKNRQDEIDKAITAELISDSFIAEHPEIESYTDTASDGELYPVLVTIHQDAADFQLVSVEVESLDSGGYKCTGKEEIYSFGPVAAEHSVILRVSKPESDPERGIYLIGSDGSHQIYFIFFNSSDGKPFFWAE